MEYFFRKVRLSLSASAALTLLAGLVLTALLFASLRSTESAQARMRFEAAAAARITAVSRGLTDAVEQALVINQLMNTIGKVSQKEFATFSAPLLVRYPEIQALSYQRTLLHADRDRFERDMRARHPGFRITEFVDGAQRPAAVRERYNVVEYIIPYKGNESALGVDTGRTVDQAEARARSRSHGGVAATGLLTLVQRKGVNTGFLVLAPVYPPGQASAVSPAAREVVGETAAVFRGEHLIRTLLQRNHFPDTAGMSVAVYAAATAAPPELVFRDGGDAPFALSHPLLRNWLIYNEARPKSASFAVGGTVWQMHVAQAPVLFSDTGGGALYALLGGLLSSVLATAAVYSLVTRHAAIEKVAGARTASLRRDNARLAEDLALRVRTEQSMRLRERVIEVSSNAIIICSAEAPDYVVEYVNPAFEAITGYSAAEVLGRSLRALQGASHDQQNIEEISAALRERREGHAVLRNYRKDGSGYWNDLFISPVRDDAGTIVNFVVAQYDVSAIMRFEAELEFQAHHDALTGLANRNLLALRLARAIDSAHYAGAELWVVFVDLDRFKFVNDTLGHDAGDSLLKLLAERLCKAVREGDTVARMGGDEFVLVLPTCESRDQGMAVIASVMDAIAEPLHIQSHEFFITCSMGIAIYPADGTSADVLTKHADIAMYRAKESGRNTFQFYTPEMSLRTLARLEIEADLHHALERGELVLHYQPQVDVLSGHITGMEVLLRWQHPRFGMIAPGRFIALAEEMGLIVPIGQWVLHSACAQTLAWQQAGLGRMRVAVNVSARQFAEKSLADSVAQVLAETGLDASCLELELTESVVINDVDSAVTILGELKQLGVNIAIDDFGTGYSSLASLRRFPIDVLKIDQSFVQDITLEDDGAVVVRSIISLAHSLRLKVVAEGVETTEQLDYLREQQCDQAQGFLYGRPCSATEFAALLKHGLQRRSPSESVSHAHVQG